MAGAVGGGLGNLAIQYGYQRFDVGVMISTIVILIGLVQIVQFLGDLLAQRMKKNKSQLYQDSSTFFVVL